MSAERVAGTQARPAVQTLPALEGRPTSEAALLAAIHSFAAAYCPRLDKLLPVRAREGDPVLLLGSGLQGGELRAQFGTLTTWAVPLSDRCAVAFVPPGAAGGPLSVRREGLRSNSLVFGGPPASDAPRVVRVDPRDGATGVFRDGPVLLHLSHPLDPATLDARTLRVEDPVGPVPARLRLSPDGRVAIWKSERLLAPEVEHTIVACGLRDLRGRDVDPHVSRFTPWTLTAEDLAG